MCIVIFTEELQVNHHLRLILLQANGLLVLHQQQGSQPSAESKMGIKVKLNFQCSYPGNTQWQFYWPRNALAKVDQLHDDEEKLSDQSSDLAHKV